MKYFFLLFHYNNRSTVIITIEPTRVSGPIMIRFSLDNNRYLNQGYSLDFLREGGRATKVVGEEAEYSRRVEPKLLKSLDKIINSTIS